MRKHKLDPDGLVVQSFDVGAEAGRGTVVGMEGPTDCSLCVEASLVQPFTCAEQWQTCGNTCDYFANTCDNQATCEGGITGCTGEVTSIPTGYCTPRACALGTYAQCTQFDCTPIVACP